MGTVADPDLQTRGYGHPEVVGGRGRGFPGILGGGMPPGSPNSDPTLDQILRTLRSNDADDNENVKKKQ